MRILILEDEPSMAALLEQVVKNLWPRAFVRLAADAFSALDHWKSEGADLALLDWELPGMNGIEVLKHIKHTAGKTVCVMVSAHADRSKILAAGLHHVDAFIVKPFDIEQLKARLTAIMTAAGGASETSSEAAAAFASLEESLDFQLTRGSLGLPIAPELVYAVKGIRHLSSDDIRGLLQRCKQEPALVQRALSLANKQGEPEPVETFGAALRRIGLDGLFNLTVELSLLKGSALKHEWLRARYLELIGDSLALCGIVKKLGADLGVDVEAARTACMLSRIGEMSLLQIMQGWSDLGHSLDRHSCADILKRKYSLAAARIQSQWPITDRIRARLTAIRELPDGTTDKDLLLMRAAGLIHSRDADQGLSALLTRLGLPGSTAQRYRRTATSA